MRFIRVEGFNTQPVRALKKGIKPRVQIPYKNNIPRPFRAGLLIRYFFVLLTVLFLLSPSFSAAQEIDIEALNDFSSALAAQLPAEPSANGESAVSAASTENFPEVNRIAETAAGITENFSSGEMPFFQKLAIAILIIAVQAALIWLLWYLFNRLKNKIEVSGKDKVKPLVFKKIKVLSTKQIISTVQSFLRFLKYLITLVMLFLTIPVVFSFFDATHNFASTLFGYILTPVRNIALGAVGYIPNLFTIIIVIIITRYVLKALKFFADKIAKGKLIIPGFYADWAHPTYKILQVLLLAFTVAILYPYLPGSDSRAFQGVSVFVGIVFSLGSTSAIGNLVAGLVITYMRPFKIGDRVKIKEITGFVVEKNLMVVRLKTHKNEYVTFPNIVILGSSIINYNTSSDEDEEGLIIFAEITFGYATPWQTIHDILINAAHATEHVQKKPKPFVLQTKLDDFYACYQINCYTKEVSMVPRIYTLLYENIQNGFREAGLDLTASHYRVITKT